ncbi:MAG: 3-oxoacyl-ACP reductase family protein [Alphaproteobacteria bacterium]
MKLKDRVAIVTGSSRGIGHAIALKLARDGAKLVINCRNTVDRGRAVVREIKDGGGDAMVIQADVGSRPDAERLIRDSLKAYGKIDILVSNAGIIIDKPFVASTDEDWQAAMHSNLDAFFYLTRAVLPHMIERRHGRILATGSIITEVYDFGPNKMSVCTASKAGIVTMLKAIAAEVAESGVTVNSVSPGYIATEMFATIDPKGKEAALRMIPMRRYGAPEDIANAMAFLASDEASYITGQTLRVNGGMSMG